MKVKHRLLSILGAIIGTAFICMLFANTSLAATLINTDTNSSLTLNYQNGKKILSDVPVKIYNVASISNTGKYTFVGDFETYTAYIKINNISSASEWKATAQTLANYIVADKISFTNKNSTNDEGSVSFNNLLTGLYLVISDPISSGGKKYSFTPFLISLPSLDEQDQWLYDITANPKSTSHSNSNHNNDDDDNEKNNGDLSYNVVKQWKDTGHKDERPESIKIEILKNGETYATKTLSEENNWSYRWTASKNDSTWQVVERDIKEPYQVTTTITTTKITITNTYNEEDEEEKDPESIPLSIPTNPGITEENILSNGNSPEDSAENSPNDSSEDLSQDTPQTSSQSLPQTGQLWWPIPLMAVIGLLIFIFGWLLVAKDKRKNEK